jgi:hypothetical protein
MPRPIAVSKKSATPSGSSPFELDRRDRLVIHALLANGFVVPLAIPVEVYGEGQIWRRLVLVDVLRQQNRVGAEIYKLLARDDAGDDLRHLLVDQRLSAGDGDHGRAALVDRAQRILDAHALLQDLFRVIDLAASRAREIALEQRLEHEHERVALLASELASGQILGHPINLQ